MRDSPFFSLLKCCFFLVEISNRSFAKRFPLSFFALKFVLFNFPTFFYWNRPSTNFHLSSMTLIFFTASPGLKGEYLSIND